MSSNTKYSVMTQKLKRNHFDNPAVERVVHDVFWWDVYIAVPPLISRGMRSKIHWQSALDPRAKRLERRLNYLIYLEFLETGNFDHVYSHADDSSTS